MSGATTADLQQGRLLPTRLILPLLALAIVLACAISTIVSLLLIKATFNTVFVSDQWETVNLYERTLQGVPSFGDLIAQHKEHRIFLPRLIFLLDYAFDAGRNRINVAANLLIQLVHVALFIRIHSRIRAGYPLQLALALFIVLLFFGVYQYENFISGFQHQFLAVQLYATAAAWAVTSAQERGSEGRPYGVTLGIGIALGIASALTMANGAVALLCVAFTMALAGWNNRLTYAVAAAGLLVFAAYVFTFTPNPGHTSLGFSLTHPLLVSGHVSVYLGAIFQALAPRAAIVGGAAGLLCLGASLAALAAGSIARNRVNVTLVSVMSFVAATATLTALGRSSFGIEQGNASRYCSTSAVFWAALVCLAVSVIVEKFDKSARDKTAVAMTALGGVAALVLVSTAISQYRYRGFAQFWNPAMVRATTALLTGAEDETALKAVYPDVAQLNRFRAILMSHRLSIFAEIRPWELGKVITADRVIADADHCAGRIEKMDALPGLEPGLMKAEGWSWNARTHRPFDRLVFLSQDGVVSGYAMTPAFGWATKLDASTAGSVGSRWYGHVRAGTGPVRAYAILDGENKLCPLAVAPRG